MRLFFRYSGGKVEAVNSTPSQVLAQIDNNKLPSIESDVKMDQEEIVKPPVKVVPVVKIEESSKENCENGNKNNIIK